MAYIDTLLKKAKTAGPEEKAKAETGALAELEEVAKGEREAGRLLVESYGSVRVFKVPGESLYFYEVPAHRRTGEEKTVIDQLVNISAKVIEPMPFVTASGRRRAYFERVLTIIDGTPELKVPPAAREAYAEAAVREMIGYGLIDPLLTDDLLEEIMVIGPGKPVYVFHRKYDMMRTSLTFYDDEDIKDLIDRIARGIGRRIDFQSPIMDARLPDGTRVTATIPPASIDGSTLTIRKFRREPFTIIDLINFGTINYEVGALLWLAADGLGARPANVVVAGGAAAGKTTMLNVMCSLVAPTERIITIEDIAELQLPHEHWIRLEGRPPGVEQTGEITLDDLAKNALHMRPDRIIVGEIRGAEGYTLFSAMNTGHIGSMGTVHANSAHETVIRLTSPPISVPARMLAPLNLLLMQQRINDRRKGLIRRVTEIAEIVAVEGDKPEMQILYQWDPSKDTFLPTGMESNYLQILGRFTGLTKEGIQEELARRAQVLRELNEKGVRSLPELSKIVHEYALKYRARV
jgi:flagellar protein FlaI